MVESLHFDIQSTGQKSHCVTTPQGPSQCYVLIRQSDSPCPCQFQLGITHRKAAPCPWSQSLSQSYGSILPTSLTYLLLSTRGCSPWRPAAVIGTTGTAMTAAEAADLPWIFTVRHGLPRPLQMKQLFQSTHPFSNSIASRVCSLLKRKDNSSQAPSRRLQVPRRCRSHRASRLRNINLIPFRAPLAGLVCVSMPLRIGSPMANQCSHGTLPHFSLQSSLLNICYYHQDLH